MNERIIEEAIHWHVAQQGGGDVDWAAFAGWLEAAPDHRVAYDEIALLDQDIDIHRDGIRRILDEPVEDDAPAPRRRAWPVLLGAGTAVAAGLALFLAIPMIPSGSRQPVVYETGPGQTRSVALADGSRIELAAASRLLVSGEGQSDLALHGGAYFDVPHDPGRTLVIHAGDYEVRDIGTRFDISSERGNLRVAVADGALSVAAEALLRPVRLQSGQRLTVSGARRAAELSPISPADVGSWRAGRLVYENAPLALVAAEISRYAPEPVIADPDVAGRRFSGVLTIGDGSGLVGNLQQIMGLETRVEDGAVHLVADGAGGG